MGACWISAGAGPVAGKTNRSSLAAALTESTCQCCHGDVTRQSAAAWEQLAAFLQSRPLKAGGAVDLLEVFPRRTAARMLQVHLHFVKVFGSEIEHIGLPIDLKPFSTAILKEDPHPHVYLAFGAFCEQQLGPVDIYVAERNGCVVYANWLCCDLPTPVSVIYAEPAMEPDLRYSPEITLCQNHLSVRALIACAAQVGFAESDGRPCICNQSPNPVLLVPITKDA